MADKDIFIASGPKKPDNPHSNFDLSFCNNLTARFGRVIPCFTKLLPAGSRIKITPSMVFDLMPLVYPVQTNVRAHIKFYKIPLRILWDKAEQFFAGLGDDGLPANQSAEPLTRPYISRSEWCDVGSLAEYMQVCNQKYDNLVTAKGIVNVPYLEWYTPSIWERLAGVPNPNDRPGLLCSPYRFKLKFKASQGIVFDGADLFSFPFKSVESNPSGKLGFKLIDSNGKVVYENTLSATTSSTATGYRIASVTEATGQRATTRFMVQFATSDQADIMSHIRTYEQQDTTLYIQLYSEDTNFCYPFSRFVSAYVLPGSLVKVEETSLKQTFSLQSTHEPLSSLLISYSYQYYPEGKSTIFDSVNGAVPVQPISALPFRAYEFIYNYFFRNERVAPFTKDGKPSYNEFLTNTGSGADSTTPVDFFNALYEYDYFTTAVKEPQFGNAPLVGVTVNDLGNEGILSFNDGSKDGSYTIKLDINTEGQVLPLSVYKDGPADEPRMARLNELINFGISINDLRNVSTFQRMLERYQRSGHKYENVVYEFFGTNPPTGDNYPTYLGGFNRSMSVQKITNTALSPDAALGEFAGQARIDSNGKKSPTISCFCSEPCYIMGLIYFTPTPIYSQYLPKHFIYSDLLDFYVNPDFATIGPQPIYKKELAPTQCSVANMDEVFGYQRPYADMVASFDEAHGLFKTSMQNFLLQRKFFTPPQLNQSFIEVRSDDLTNIFSVTEDTDKIFGQVYFDVNLQLPYPRTYSARSI